MIHNFQISATTLTVIFFSFFAITLNAQDNVLKVTPLQPVLGKMSIAYEREIAPRTTAMVEFQRWFENRSNGGGFIFLPIIASSNEKNSNRGYRMNFLMRRYSKTALNGTFGEAGFYVGKHDIKTQTENSILTFDSDLFFLPTYETTITQEEYKNVRVGGLKLGAGWARTRGNFNVEVSGGFNLNAFNDQDVRPTLGMKTVSPYGRIAVGVKF